MSSLRLAEKASLVSSSAFKVVTYALIRVACGLLYRLILSNIICSFTGINESAEEIVACGTDKMFSWQVTSSTFPVEAVATFLPLSTVLAYSP